MDTDDRETRKEFDLADAGVITGVDADCVMVFAPPRIGEWQDPNIGLLGGVEDTKDLRGGPNRGVRLAHRGTKLSDFPCEVCGGGRAVCGTGVPDGAVKESFFAMGTYEWTPM